MSAKEFKLDEGIEYEIEGLNLFKSCQESDTRFLNDEKLDVLIEAMSKTSLKNSLIHVALDEQDYEADEKLEIFKQHGFNLTVHLDEDLPSPVKRRSENEFENSTGLDE